LVTGQKEDMRSRDALGDAGDPEASATPVPAGHQKAHSEPSPTTSQIGALAPSQSGAGSAVARGSDRGRTTVAAGTPGEKFQSHVLYHFYSLVSFSLSDPLCSLSPGELWLTPPFLFPCFTIACVEHLLNFFFSAPPERLLVRLVAPNIFKTRFASADVPRYVVIWGP
jgi:hypothetical protein